MIPTPLLERLFVAALWVAHPGVDAHLDSLDRVETVEGVEHTRYGNIPEKSHVYMLLWGNELDDCREHPTTVLEYSTNAHSTWEARVWRSKHSEYRSYPSVMSLVNRRHGDNLDYEYALLKSQLAFVDAHVAHLEACALLSSSDAPRIRARADAWKARAVPWRYLLVALDRAYGTTYRRYHLELLRLEVGDARFYALELPPLLSFYPDPYRDE